MISWDLAQIATKSFKANRIWLLIGYSAIHYLASFQYRERLLATLPD